MARQILIIGAGWYGCHMARSLLLRGYEVELWEKGNEIFSGASRFNQNRLHQGFHYPRCKETRVQSKRGFHLFKKEYGHITESLRHNLYAISETESILDFQTFKDIMLASGLSFEDLTDVSPLQLQKIGGILDCEELLVSPDRAIEYFSRELAGVIHLEKEVNAKDLGLLKKSYSLVIDCTWLGLRSSPDAYYESCLYFTARTRGFSDVALTLMDGKLFSLYPYDEYTHTITHVEHTPFSAHNTQSDAYLEIEKCRENRVFIEKKKEEIEAHISEYFPEFISHFYDFEPQFAVKSKLKSYTDSRYVKITLEDNYCQIFSGKIDTIFDAESMVTNIVRRVLC